MFDCNQPMLNQNPLFVMICVCEKNRKLFTGKHFHFSTQILIPHHTLRKSLVKNVEGIERLEL